MVAETYSISDAGRLSGIVGVNFLTAVSSQEELIKSEEERLAISQALLTMQLDLNHAQASSHNYKQSLMLHAKH